MTEHAIVRSPPSSFRGCISSHPLLHTLDLTVAIKQHQEYCRTLNELGLEIIRLPVDEAHPDSCFVEDTVVIHRDKAVITRMAKESRRGEEEQVEEILREYKRLRRIQDPATIEGGDVIHLEKYLISGITERTNHEGVFQASDLLRTRIEVIEDPSIVHLKSHVTFLGAGTFVVTQRFADHPLLRKYRRLVVPADEAYAANTLAIDNVILMSEKHPKSIQLLKEAGFDIVPVEMSEFEKCEGALTCLSITF